MQTYKDLQGHEKQHYRSFAAHWLSLKPELIGKVSSDRELIERLDAFAEVLHDDYIIDRDRLPPRP